MIEWRMICCLESTELWLGRLGGVMLAVMLAAALWRIRWALAQPSGVEEPAARRIVRLPQILIATAVFIVLAVVLWRPLPVALSNPLRGVLLATGSLLYFGGLALYLWGLAVMGSMFGPSSGFGVRLHTGHRLVTGGPFALVRHPMYLGVIAATFGSLALYRTWATVFFSATMLGLIIRARREERVLAETFGDEWLDYAARVPAFIPRLRFRRRSSPSGVR